MNHLRGFRSVLSSTVCNNIYKLLATAIIAVITTFFKNLIYRNVAHSFSAYERFIRIYAFT